MLRSVADPFLFFFQLFVHAKASLGRLFSWLWRIGGGRWRGQSLGLIFPLHRGKSREQHRNIHADHLENWGRRGCQRRAVCPRKYLDEIFPPPRFVMSYCRHVVYQVYFFVTLSNIAICMYPINRSICLQVDHQVNMNINARCATATGQGVALGRPGGGGAGVPRSAIGRALFPGRGAHGLPGPRLVHAGVRLLLLQHR